MIKLGFVGLGRVADVHHEAVERESGRARVAAVCDVRAEAVEARASAWGARGHTDYREMLEREELDAVCLFVPHDLHEQYVARAAEKGYPVFLEKPLATDLDACRRMVESCRRHDVLQRVVPSRVRPACPGAFRPYTWGLRSHQVRLQGMRNKKDSGLDPIT
jgi:predicted dehydrogenase